MAKTDYIRFRCEPEFKKSALKAAAMDKVAKGDLTAYIESLIRKDIAEKTKGKGERTMNNSYYISFGTGAGAFEMQDSLENAKKEAVKLCAYTQADIKIYQGSELVARLPWHGYEPGEDEAVTESFGNFGFYGEWLDV